MGKSLLLGAVLLLASACSSNDAAFTVINQFSAFSAIRVGVNHTCATKDGKTKCWGVNASGQVGDFTNSNRLVPTEVFNLPVRASGISSGTNFSCALIGTRVQCWGQNDQNQLNAAGANRNLPLLNANVNGAVAIQSGSEFSCVLMGGAGPGPMCWGRNDFGQIGNGGAGATVFAPPASPALVGGATATGTVPALSVGLRHACVIRDNGIQCWGDNAAGQIGTGVAGGTVTAPSAVAGYGSDVAATLVAAGSDHTCAVVKGELLCWGANAAGQLGTGDTTAQLKPTKVVDIAKDEVQQLFAGDRTTCVITMAGAAKCWGLNDSGQLGDTTVENKSRPTVVDGLGFGVRAFAAPFSKHACAIQGDTIKCWGLNSSGQIGDGTTENRLAPVAIAF